jgi:hypothetical protein
VPINTNVDNYLVHSPIKDRPCADRALKESFKKTYEDCNIHLFADSRELGIEDGFNGSGAMWDFATPKPKESVILNTPTPRRINHSGSTRAPDSVSPYSLDSTPYSDNEGDLNDTPRTAKGLK